MVDYEPDSITAIENVVKAALRQEYDAGRTLSMSSGPGHYLLVDDSGNRFELTLSVKAVEFDAYGTVTVELEGIRGQKT